MPESIEGKVDKLNEAPLSKPVIYYIRRALYEGHEWLQLPADMLGVVEVVALQELGYQLQNQLHVGEIRIRLRDLRPDEYEF